MLCRSTLTQPDLMPHNCRNHDNSTVEIREAVSSTRECEASWLKLNEVLNTARLSPQGKFPYNYEELWGKAHASSKCDGPERVFPSLYPGDCLFWGVNNLRCLLRSKLENEWISILWIKTKTPSCSCRMSYNSRSFGYLHCKEWEAVLKRICT